MSKGHRLYVIIAAAVGAFLLFRWWKMHKARVVASPGDSPLSQAVDAIAPGSAPRPGIALPGATVIDLQPPPRSTEIAPGVVVATNTGILPPSWTKQQLYQGTPILSPYQRPGVA